jgi:hypothetical protein
MAKEINKQSVPTDESPSWYRRWHENPSSSLWHWSFFILAAVVLFYYTTNGAKNLPQLVASLDTTQASQAHPVLPNYANSLPLSDRTKASDLVIVGTVAKATTVMATNSFHDKFLVTHTNVHVDELLKGSASGNINADLIGGTLNGITMRVDGTTISGRRLEQPDPLKAGERAVWFLRYDPTVTAYRISPFGEEALVQLSPSGNSLDGSNLTLDQIRTAVKGAR